MAIQNRNRNRVVAVAVGTAVASALWLAVGRPPVEALGWGPRRVSRRRSA